jgi:putative transcriptional regulator
MPREIILRNNIRELRFFANEMTQKELAQKAGVSRQTIIAIEGGDYSPSLKLAFSIAEVFNLPITEVFSYEVREENKKKKK